MFCIQGEIMKNKKSSWLLLLGMLTLLLIVLYVLFIRPNYYLINGGEIYLEAIQAGKLDLKEGARIETMQEALYIATREGLTKLSLKGEHIWNKSYHFKELLFLKEEKCLATIDVTGKEAFIFDENGQTAHIKTDYTIISATLNATGYLVLVLENDHEHQIHMYNYEGKLIATRHTLFKKDGYPIYVALSPDGTKMVTTHLNVSHYSIQSILTFMDFSNKGEAFEDKITSHKQMEGTMASKTCFLDNNYCVIIGDDQLLFYYIDTVPELIKTVPLSAEILEVVHTKSEIILYFDQGLDIEGDDGHSVMVYSKDGKEVALYKKSEERLHLGSDGEKYYLIERADITQYRGKRKIWTSHLHKEVERIYPLENKKFLVIYKYNYEILQVKDI